jgi:predicted DNA-binding transcriptional regulator AlpA
MTEYLLPNQLASHWGVSANTLRKWRWEGKGPRFVKLGRKVVYRRTDIDAFANAQLRNSTSDTGSIATHH